MDTRFRPFLQTLEEEEEFREELGEKVFRSRFNPSKNNTIIDNAYAKGELTLGDLKPLHLEAAWRITRMHTLAKFQINPSEQLGLLQPEQWAMPMPDVSNVGRSTTAQALADIWAGLPLQPTQANVDEFVVSVARTAKVLQIPKTALYLLDDTRTLLQHYPHPDEIVEEEHRFCLNLLDTFLGGGANTIVQELVCKRAFLKLEAQSYLPLVRAASVENTYLDPDTDQRVMIARTESLIGRAQESLDLSTELGGLRHLATVQGLGKITPQDSFSDFANIIRELAAEEKKNGTKRISDQRRAIDTGDSGS